MTVGSLWYLSGRPLTRTDSRSNVRRSKWKKVDQVGSRLITKQIEPFFLPCLFSDAPSPAN